MIPPKPVAPRKLIRVQFEQAEDRPWLYVGDVSQLVPPYVCLVCQRCVPKIRMLSDLDSISNVTYQQVTMTPYLIYFSGKGHEKDRHVFNVGQCSKCGTFYWQFGAFVLSPVSNQPVRKRVLHHARRA